MMKLVYETGGLVLGLLLLSGCVSDAQSPESINKQDILAAQPSFSKQLDLGEALARAMLYNLDNRVKTMELAIAEGNANLENFDMLPEMTVSAGYFRRDREDLSSSKNAITGLLSPATGTSSDREQVSVALGETWNALDFGIALVRSQELRAAEQAALQRRRQSLQNILNETRYAYARAGVAQRIRVELDVMLKEINGALVAQERLERSGVAAPLGVLRQQRDLLAIYNELLTLRQLLVSAHRELNALVSLPPGMDVKLAPLPLVKVPEPLNLREREVEILEVVALQMHPELRVADSQVFAQQREIQRAFLSMMPNIEVSKIGNYGSNTFSVYNVYNTLGVRLTHNLINLQRLPALREQGRARLGLEEKKRMALGLAVITKVHLALANFNALRDEYQFATDRASISSALADIMRARYQAGEVSLHERLSAEFFALDTRLKTELLGAELVNAIGQIYTNLGIDTVPYGFATDNLAALSEGLQERVAMLSNINRNLIPLAAAIAPSSL